MLQAYVPNEGTAWVHAREELRRFFERVLTRHREDAAPDAAPRALAELAAAEPPAAARDVIGAYLDLAALLGRRTAEMHLALASNVDDAELHAGPVLDARPAIELPVGAQPGRQDAAPAARLPATGSRPASSTTRAGWSAGRIRC